MAETGKPQPPVFLPPRLLAAWRATEYRVDTGAGTLVLRIGRRSARLDALMRAAGARAAAYVSADNPGSRLAPPAANAAARTRLRARLEAAGRPFLPGLGIDPRGSHPGETSFLVLGLTLAEARALGRDFGQDGIVWIGADGVPRIELVAAGPGGDDAGS